MLQKLTRITYDFEHIYRCVHKEEDADVKQVYFYMFKVAFYHYF